MLTTSNSSPLRWAFRTVLAVPVLFAVWIVIGQGFVVPRADQWWFLDFYDRVLSGDATLHDLFAPHHGPHIIASGRLILGAMALATGWSFAWEAALDLAILLGTTLALARLGLRAAPHAGTRATSAALLVMVLVVWSPVAHWSWTWTIGFMHFFTNGCVVLAALALVPDQGDRSAWRFGLACTLCVGASFARIEGLFAWIALLPCLLGPGRRSSRSVHQLAIWFGLAALSWGVCIVAMTHPPGGDGGGSLGLPGLRHPLYAAGHFFSLLGLPLGYFTGDFLPSVSRRLVFLPMGLLVFSGCVASLFLLYRSGSDRLRHAALPWLSIAIFALLFASTATIARYSHAGFGPVLDIYLSMYSTTLAMFSVATFQLGILALATSSRRWRRGTLGAALAMVLLCSAMNYVVLVPKLLAERKLGRGERYCVELVHYLELHNACFHASEKIVGQLDRTGLREIRKNLSFVSDSDDVLGALVEAKAVEGGGVVVSGWASLRDGRLPDAVVLAHPRSPGTIFAAAQRLTVEGDRALWSVQLDTRLTRGDPEPVTAWIYDRPGRRFLALDGGASVAGPVRGKGIEPEQLRRTMEKLQKLIDRGWQPKPRR